MAPYNIGLFSAILAQFLWGLFPFYWKLLVDVNSLEVLAHRGVWCMVFLGGLVLLSATRRRSTYLTMRSLRQIGLHFLAGLLIAVNWGTYIYAVSIDRVIEASLGYFLAPLISVALGALVFKEAMTKLALFAVFLAFAAVLLLLTLSERIPFIGLMLALSFSCYGLLRKRAATGPVTGLFVESLLVTPLALIGLCYLHQSVGLSFSNGDPWIDRYLVLGGVITAVPLLLFGTGARHLALGLSGMLGYITPIMQFFIGWLVFGESIASLTWLAFFIIWLALIIFTINSRQQLRV